MVYFIIFFIFKAIIYLFYFKNEKLNYNKYINKYIYIFTGCIKHCELSKLAIQISVIISTNLNSPNPKLPCKSVIYFILINHTINIYPYELPTSRNKSFKPGYKNTSISRKTADLANQTTLYRTLNVPTNQRIVISRKLNNDIIVGIYCGCRCGAYRYP